ncbi:MAG: divalent metal cation transporter [Armatimonadetes bacterium]|nr:divalent metal cation transporter [Armatimonadota bacterium]
MGVFFRKFRKHFLLLLAVVGPGIVTALADNDAGGVLTYSIAGARYGFRLLWVLTLSTIVLLIVQEMCARMGAVTGKGLSDLIRERYGVSWTLFAMAVLLIANLFTTIANFAGIAGSLEIFHISRTVSIPLVSLLLWAVVVLGTYRGLEKFLLTICLGYLGYVVCGIILHPPWKEVIRACVLPTFTPGADFVKVMIAVVGTTVTPWMQFFLQSMVADKGITEKTYRYEKLDVWVGSILTGVIAFFIILCSALTLCQSGGGQDIVMPQDAARALEPLAGHHAEWLFATGLLGASVLAAVIVPLSTSYGICEAFGWESSVGKRLWEAPVFFGLYTALIVIGASTILLPVSLVKVMFFSQFLNGILLPVILVFMLGLVNDRKLMGAHVNGPFYNVVCWITVAGLAGLSIALLFL